MVVDAAKKKSSKSDRSYKYPQALLDASAYFLMIAGSQAYDFASSNLALPSLRTARRQIYVPETLVEGQLRVNELKNFLTEQNLPFRVCLSEDGTGIENRVQYHRATNQVVGFPPPLDSNGMPIPLSFPATSVRRIKEYFDNFKPSRLLYTVIAQPLKENASFFCLLMWGTDEKYKSSEVTKRWEFIKSCLEKESIVVEGQSTDGDTKAFKSMETLSNLNFGKENLNSQIPGFQSTLRQEYVCMQDIVHMAGRIRCRLLKPSIILVFGDSLVTITHLKTLISYIPKDEHALDYKSIYRVDKMDFDIVLKLCHPNVAVCLQKYIPDSEGTQQYLKLLHMMVYSFLLEGLSVENRLYYLWYIVFFLRLLRSWILDHEVYNVSNNFITLNSY